VRRAVTRDRPRLVHLTTTDMSLDWLLGPQLQAFAVAGFEVIGMSAPGPHVPALEAAGIRHVAVEHATRAISPTDDLAALVELRGLFQRLQPDIVHTHNPKPGVYGRLAARSTGVPVVVNTQHGLYATPEDPLARRAFVYSLERMAASCSDAELVQNEEDVETLARLGVDRGKLAVLGNGIDLTRFAPDPSGEVRQAVRAELGVTDDEVVVGLVGRLVAEKGYREVFAAAELLRARAPQARFVVIGPEEHAKADALTEGELQAARTNGVLLLGQRTDVERLYTGMDVYVLASHREGFPRSAMEAAATGLPVVATDIRGCRQVVDHERNGLLVPVRSPQDLADAVERLVAAPDLREKMAAAAIEKAQRDFDQQRVIDLTLETYRRLLP
jgi:glycosyltransferase involved in cell wall biosynthesis